MKLTIITKPEFFVEEDKIIAALFEEGLDTLHLYKPGSSPLYFERLLTLIPEEYHRHIVIHEHYYMKSEFELAGIHIDDPNEEVPAGFRGNVSRCCQDLSMLKAIKKQSKYVFLHNIFDSIHENDVKSTFTEEQLIAARREGLIDKHVHALGGMNADRARWAKDMGFGGIVVCGDLWNKFDVHHSTSYHDLLSHFHRLRKAVG